MSICVVETKGQAGKFEIANASSTQPGLLVMTAGSGNSVQSIVNTTDEIGDLMSRRKAWALPLGMSGARWPPS